MTVVAIPWRRNTTLEESIEEGEYIQRASCVPFVIIPPVWDTRQDVRPLRTTSRLQNTLESGCPSLTHTNKPSVSCAIYDLCQYRSQCCLSTKISTRSKTRRNRFPSLVITSLTPIHWRKTRGRTSLPVSR